MHSTHTLSPALRNPYSRNPYSRKRRRREKPQATLLEADYSIYQTLPPEEITEELLWSRLKPLLRYLEPEDIQKVQEALSLAMDAHKGQMRKSGEPFITHPLEVTRLLAELRMDKDSLIAGLLHDTVEDQPGQVTFEEIGNWFGPDVQTIVEGETKFSKLGNLSSDSGSSVDVKARDLQHLFIAMTKEVRIIVVKLADRLHNMRTLGSMPPHKQKKIAEETLQVFAPLARLLGLYSVKEELEELAFGYSKPEEYAKLRQHLNLLAEDQEPGVQQAKKTLEDMLNNDVYLHHNQAEPVTVMATQKSVYSVYRKLEENGGELKNVADVAQLCVIIPQQKEKKDTYLYGTGNQLCYHVMGLVHTKWPPIPGSIKDYISTPKRNGYQSLHTTVLPLGNTVLFPLEVQIRTSKMQELAEFGIAGEEWVAKGQWNYSFDSHDLDLELKAAESVRPADHCRGGTSRSLMEAIFNMLPLNLLPRMVGLNSDLLSGNASLTMSGSVLSAEQRARFGGEARPSLGDSLKGGKQVANGYAKPQGTRDASLSGAYVGQDGAIRLDRDVMQRREHWLKSIIEWQKEFVECLTAREFVDGITDDLLGRGVFVFTPRGDIMRLPKDSTTVDFAYHVHTVLGNQMVGAKVNGKLVDPDHLLGNAEVVEILSYNGQPTTVSVTRHHEWAKFTKSKTARHKLAKFLKDHAHLLPSHLRATPAVDSGSSSGQEAGSGQEGAGGERREAPPETDAEDIPENTFRLDVVGDDEPGLLVQLASIISKHGNDVKTYRGSVNHTSGTLCMCFEVQGIADIGMCREISLAPCVRSWQLDLDRSRL